VHGRLDLIGNDELDGGGLERVLGIEPDHEVKNLILGKKNRETAYQNNREREWVGRRWRRPQRSGVPIRVGKTKKHTHLVQAFPENLYREKPRLEIFGLEQLDTCPWGGRRLKVGAPGRAKRG
jgi:hypothetical protein